MPAGRGRGTLLNSMLAKKKETESDGYAGNVKPRVLEVGSNVLPKTATHTSDGNGHKHKQSDIMQSSDKRWDANACGDDSVDFLKAVTASYLIDDSVELQTSLVKTKEVVNSMLVDDANMCLICLDTIQRTEAIWSCSYCYCIIHLPCIRQWISEGSYQQRLSTLSEEHFPNKKLPWHCPKCRTDYEHSKTPSVYKCFCEKKIDPEDDKWLVPHSCGETCGKELKPACGHKCLLLCHPGPCPPCPKLVNIACFCGQKSSSRRCATSEWSCNHVCNKLLNCKQHRCQDICHKGSCPPCQQVSNQKCFCGKQIQKRLCAEPDWSCEQVCGRKLSCGQHTCPKLCHSSESCGVCERSARVRFCPCGKASVTNLPCTADVPCCGDTCGKKLACGLHSCTEKCHTGLCGQCLQMSMKSCRCGAKQRELPCAKAFTCETKCLNYRSCKRHQCKRRCCDGTSCPECDQKCDKKLNCGNHKCTSTCHTGLCYPCPVTVNKSCACGETVISIPCIRQKSAKPPFCRIPCKKPSICDHPSIQRHLCHAGDCPPCGLVCGKKLNNCSHTCSNQCHTAVKVKVQQQNAQASTPWDSKVYSYTEIVNRPCPPCPVLVPVRCKGEHETSNLPCSNSAIYSCNRDCGRLLKCGNHTCGLECHEVSQAPDDKRCGIECEPCENPCEKTRPDGCTHSCLKPCHPYECPPCKQMNKARCHCGATVIYIPCFEWTNKLVDKTEKLKCPGNCPKQLPCGHQCSLKCHAGQCSLECSKKVVVRCPCKTMQEFFPCQTSKTAQVSCTDSCKKNKELPADSNEEALESDVAMSEVELSHMLPGRRQRKRKQRNPDEVDKKKFEWKIVQKYTAYAVTCLAIFLAFFYALMSEN